MIVNTEMRKSQEEERINLRCSQETFTNIITAGSNCSERDGSRAKRIRQILRISKVHNSLQTALITGYSIALVNLCLSLKNEIIKYMEYYR
jgi:hypothetical protein